MRTLGTHIVSGETVRLSAEDWRQHTYAIGQTGTGKTNWLTSLMAQDLAQGRGFCFIDKHGDAAKLIAGSAMRPVIYWRPADLTHSIGLNLLENVPEDDRWKVTADIVSVFSDIWGLGEQTPRLLYYLRASIRLLLDTPGTTLLDIRRVLSDDRYRAKLLRDCKDSETRQTWTEFDRKDSKQQSIELGSVQNKVAALADPLPLRFVIGQPTSTISVKRILDGNVPLIVDLSGMGDEPARLLGALLVSSFAQAAEARGNQPEESRQDFTLYIDEFQNFVSEAFSKILSEARKWRLSLVLAHQYIGQVREEGLHEAILGNCGSIVAFRIGPEDAPVISRAIDAPESELKTLSRGNAWARVMENGEPHRAISLKTPLARLRTGRLEAAVRNTHASYSRPRHVVEKMLRSER